MRLAVLADIHGNRLALAAVLEDIRQRGVSAIVNLGDSLYGPLQPGETAAVLLSAGSMVNIRGNQDRLICQPGKDAQLSPTWRYVQEVLTPDQRQWLVALPANLEFDDTIFLCHGTPASDEEYLLEEVTPSGVVMRRSEKVERILETVAQRIVLCGHSHVPHTARLSSGKLIVNPGSVGLPAYHDEEPHAHVMETGSPHARYAILTHMDREWRVEHIALPYDWESAARTAAAHGRPDWAVWLRTGRAE